MIQISKEDKKRVLAGIRSGTIDAADVSFPNMIDAIIMGMHKEGHIAALRMAFEEKRDDNAQIPLEFMLALSIAAKMKLHMSMTDIPYAITDAEALSALGYNVWDSDRAVNGGMMSDGSIRSMLDKYDKEELIGSYNTYIHGHVLKKTGISPDIHILDCTKVEVNIDNEHYEGAEEAHDGEGAHRGYKLAVLRGITGDTGIIEEVRLTGMKTHDLTAGRDMVIGSPLLKPGDILINDRGFISREFMNELKNEKGVDTYIPLRKGMEAYEQAVSIAKADNQWQKHPNKKRTNQRITLVCGLGCFWRGEKLEDDVDFNACVVHSLEKVKNKRGKETGETREEYYVFITTDTAKTAKQIISTYELRPEIEEDFRQIKDFWKLEDFHTRKLTYIAFHIVMVLLGYTFYQLYRLSDIGKPCAGKSLPVMCKNYRPPDIPKSIVVYVGRYFAVFRFLEFIQLYSSCDADVRARLDGVLAKV